MDGDEPVSGVTARGSCCAAPTRWSAAASSKEIRRRPRR